MWGVPVPGEVVCLVFFFSDCWNEAVAAYTANWSKCVIVHLIDVFGICLLQKDEPSQAGVGMCILGFIMSHILPFVVYINHAYFFILQTRNTSMAMMVILA